MICICLAIGHLCFYVSIFVMAPGVPYRAGHLMSEIWTVSAILQDIGHYHGAEFKLPIVPIATQHILRHL